ncbi:MAG: HEAT repeat domain-containing protein [Planctomycetota bacterium]|jgi:HEAT repeat protein
MRIRYIVTAALVVSLAFLANGISGEPEGKVSYSKAKSEFLRTFKRGNDEEKAAAVTEFAAQDDPRAVKMIIQHALFSGSRTVTDAAFEALAGITQPRAWAVIVDRLKKERSVEKRLVFARLVGFYRAADNESIIAIENALEDDSRDIRVAVVRSLGQIKATRSMKLLEKILEGDDMRMVFEAAKALEAITDIKRKKYADPPHAGVFPDNMFTKYLYILIDASEDMDYDMPVPAADMDLLEEEKKAEPEKKEEKKKTEKKEEKKKEKKKKDEPKKNDEPPKPKEPEKPKDVLTRYQYTVKKLARFLRKLDPRVEVKIALYSSVVNPLESGFTPVKDLDIDALEKRISGIRPRGNRDTYKALQAAFAEKNLDSVILIACGLPTIGTDDPEKIVNNIIRSNHSRTVEITASALLALQASRELKEEERVWLKERFDATEDLLQKLAKATGGSYAGIRKLREAGVKEKPGEGEKPEKPVEKPPEKPVEKEKPKKPLTLTEAKSALREAIEKNDAAKARLVASELAAMNAKKAAELIAEELLELENAEMVQIAVEALGKFTDPITITWYDHAIGREKNELRRLSFVRALKTVMHPIAERELLERLKKDQSWRIRSQVIRILGERKLDKAKEILRELLKDENRRLASDAAASLAKYEGEKLNKEFTPGAVGVFPEKVFSHRLAVVLCASDSMKAEVEDPDWDPKKVKPGRKGEKKPVEVDGPPDKQQEIPRVSRLTVVKRRLEAFIDTLPENTELSIITFGDVVSQWKSEFLPMTKSNRAAAVKYVESIRAVGRNRAADTALLRALDLPEVDTICLVSDGVPEGRDVLSPEDLVSTVRELNYFRMIYIHTSAVLVSADYGKLSAVEKVKFDREKDRTVKMLEDIAGYSAGSFFKVVPEE